jgi:hypothetical protein
MIIFVFLVISVSNYSYFKLYDAILHELSAGKIFNGQFFMHFIFYTTLNMMSSFQIFLLYNASQFDLVWKILYTTAGRNAPTSCFGCLGMPLHYRKERSLRILLVWITIWIRNSNLKLCADLIQNSINYIVRLFIWI